MKESGSLKTHGVQVGEKADLYDYRKAILVEYVPMGYNKYFEEK